MNVTKIISIILLIGSLGLAYYLGDSIKSTIDEQAMINTREQAVINKLQFIREAQIAYQEVNGSYTEDWDKLADFIRNGQVPIIERKEIIIPQDYGGDSVVVEIDTIGMRSAQDRIYRATHNVNAANNGTFQGYLVEEGEEVEQGQGAYRLKQNGRIVTHPFKRKGKVDNLQDITVGDEVVKGDLLMVLIETKFDSKIDLDRLAYVPGYENEKFEIYTATVDKGGVSVNVIEVKNPKPFDPARSEDNEAKNRKPLRFGSKTDVTTSGNWE